MPRRAAKSLLRLGRKEERAHPNSFSRAAAAALGVGRREALGVRQLAAALFLFYAQTTCLEPDRHDAENNVSVPISAPDSFIHRLRQPRIGTRTIYGPRRNHGHNPNNEPVTLSTAPKHRAVVIALLAAREADTGKLMELAA